MLNKTTPWWLPWMVAWLLFSGQTMAANNEETAEHKVSQLLSQTVSESAAVEIALLNNRGIQAMLLEVGIRQADVWQAGQWPNPGYSLGVLQQGAERRIENGFHFNLAKLLFKNELQAMAAQSVLKTQKQLAAQLLQLGHETRKAHVEAVAAQSTVQYMQQVFDLAQASATLADQMKSVGNFNKLQQLREQAFHADALLGLKRAQRQAASAKEKLGRLMGLQAHQMQFFLPTALPPLPSQLSDRQTFEQQALQLRYDVQLAKLQTEQLAKNLGFTKASRFVNVLEVGITQQTSKHADVEHGLQIGFELPLFDTGEARLAKAQAQYAQSLHMVAQQALAAQSEVREAYGNYQTAHAMALHQREVVLPLQQNLAEENLLRYNAMLIGVFELLAESRQQIASVNNYTTLLKDFWLAQVDLEMAVSGKPALSPASDTSSVASTNPAH